MVQVHVRPTSLHTIHSARIVKRFSHTPTLYMSPYTRSACFSFIPLFPPLPQPTPSSLDELRLFKNASLGPAFGTVLNLCVFKRLAKNAFGTTVLTFVFILENVTLAGIRGSTNAKLRYVLQTVSTRGGSSLRGRGFHTHPRASFHSVLEHLHRS